MFLRTCPETISLIPLKPVILLAGGITGCANWQQDAIRMMNKLDAIVVNPRRANFNMMDEGMTAEQIAWEYFHLELADTILFWFPMETLCPITLYELGRASADKNKRLVVGCDPDYRRRLDVVIQLSLARPEVKVRHSLADTVADIRL